MRKKRIAAFLCAAVIAAAGLAGCGGTKAPAEVQTADVTEGENVTAGASEATAEAAADSVIVTMPTTSEPEAGFNPVYGWGAGEHVHEPLIQSTLTTTTADLKIGKDLATDYSVSEDGLTWTVSIRDDVKFTDGEPLTASDVAFTYNLCVENSSVNDFTMLKEAVAVDDTTVEFHMNTPFSIWPYTMAIVGIIPEHAYDENYGQNPIGSGRYIMKQWDKGQQVIFEANPDYYGDEVKMKKVTVLFMDEDAALAAAMAGQVDVAHTAASYADQVIDGYSLLQVASVDNRGINLPVGPVEERDGLTVGNEVTADIAVRRAINIGIDREEMITNVLGGYGTPAYSVCDKMPWYNSEAQVSYDPDGAKQLLEDAGWVPGADGIREKDGVRAAFTVMYNPGDSVRQALAEDLANQCAELGIEVTTEGAGWDVAYDKALSQPLVWGWGAHTPMELYNIYHTLPATGSAEYSPYANSTVDAYMDEALKASELEDSYDLWQKAQWDGSTGVTQEGDIPWVWLCNVDHLYYVRNGLQVAEQKIHPHGHGWSIVNNVDQWEWNE
ncbi:ABC transporter substrate-binding protein [Eisenbergiella tayi]|uniref:Oligopeptide-binding protein AppA n=1 Tax=Eisenbergiella tayi TaxID=1432052 RepID=A0A1E3ANJ3_9FIRM|nr:ABC transporter substrate-binding protein [Eisenbergiella tayi]ODM10270.1 Oligopeptide-binding protein AppA precursor [Eisenbergiella tayi]OIZ61716.1 ABC transporter substrate-binding protein [Eisenbergiella tayi]